jgi:hypothetical protein
MQLIGHSWISGARAKRRLQRRFRPIETRDDLIRRYSPGRSFADVGAMWGIHGELSFLAEESGATSVTAVDMMPSTPEFEAEKQRRGSSVRFVNGDLHDPATLEQVGKHDVVFSAGVLYHAPNPVHTLQCLREITGETLILLTATIPEVPGVENGCVFYPGLSDAARKVYVPASPGPRIGITHDFIPEGSEEKELGGGKSGTYDNWWWGISPSALKGMLTASGFEVIEEGGEPFDGRAVAQAV